MSIKIVINHYGRVKNGNLIWDTPKLLSDQLLELEGQDIVMQVKKRHVKATMSQYAYYRGVILPLCYESETFKSCLNKDEIHELYFAPRYLSYKKMIEVSGVKKEASGMRSLADLNKDEMTEFISRVVEECDNDLFVKIPPPELAYSKYYNK